MRHPQDPAKLFTLYGLKRPDENISRYVGITCHKLSIRLGRHVSAKGVNPHKDRWIAKMLPLVPEIVPYAVCLTREEACDLEVFVIAGLRNIGHPLINVSFGGEANMLGMKHSLAAKEKMSSAHIGRKVPPDVRKRISVALTGTVRGPMSPEHRKNLSNALLGTVSWNKGGKGRKWSEDEKLEISRRMKGKRNNPNGRRKQP